jgi:hypothetical protein
MGSYRTMIVRITEPINQSGVVTLLIDSNLIFLAIVYVFSEIMTIVAKFLFFDENRAGWDRYKTVNVIIVDPINQYDVVTLLINFFNFSSCYGLRLL